MVEDLHVTFSGAEARAVADILAELARMDPEGLPRDAKLATAAGSLSTRAINRARWIQQRLNKR